MIGEMYTLIKSKLGDHSGNRHANPRSALLGPAESMNEVRFQFTNELDAAAAMIDEEKKKYNRIKSIIKLPFPPTKESNAVSLINSMIQNLAQYISIEQAEEILRSDARFVAGIPEVASLDFDEDGKIEKGDLLHLLLCSYKEIQKDSNTAVAGNLPKVQEPKITKNDSTFGHQTRYEYGLSGFGKKNQVSPEQLIFCVEGTKEIYVDINYDVYVEVPSMIEEAVFVEVEDDSLVTPKEIWIEKEVEIEVIIDRYVERRKEVMMMSEQAPPGVRIKVVGPKKIVELPIERKTFITRDVTRPKLIKIKKGDPQPTIRVVEVPVERIHERSIPIDVYVEDIIPYPDQKFIDEMLSR